jgi:predicted Zn-dependent protease
VSEVLGEAEARELCQRILSASATEAEVHVESAVNGNSRYAANQLTTGGEVFDTRATVTVRFGRRSASVTFNALERSGVTAAVRKAEGLARLAPENAEQMPLLEPQPYGERVAFFDSTRELGPAPRAEAARVVTDAAERSGLVASGFLVRSASSTAVANSRGLFAFARSTVASHTVTARTADGGGSGWAGTTHNDWGRMALPAELAERAGAKAQRSVAPVEVQPAPYTVVLEPAAVGSLMRRLAAGLDARAADEGRSAFSRPGGGNRIGERVTDERVTLYSDPLDPELLEVPFTDRGEPLRRTVWIENGVVRNLAYDRFWADRQQTSPTPMGGGIKLEGASGSAEDLVSGVESGLLVTRLWYIRAVDPRDLLYTGLTRDGTFLIENGEVTRAVKNLRFNQSLVEMLNNVEAIGASKRVVAAESGGLGSAVAVPPLVVRNLRFTSSSDAI